MASAKITGVVYKVDAVIESNGYKRRSFVLFVKNEKNEQYSDYITFELFGDKVTIIDQFSTGQLVEVLFDIKGRKIPRKDGNGDAFFNSLQAYLIHNPLTTTQPQAPAQPQTPVADTLPF